MSAFKTAIEQLIADLGYEDERGFHYGEQHTD